MHVSMRITQKFNGNILVQMQKQKEQELAWYVIIDSEPRGPLSIRDLDVLLRTNEISSNMLGCKAGNSEWRRLQEIEQLKESILESSKQIVEINEKITQNSKFEKKEEKVQTEDNNQTLQFLATAVEGLVASQIFKGEDGKWNMYDQQKKEWIVQTEQPKEKIDDLKSKLLQQLKTQLFKAEGWQKPKRDDHMRQFVQNLTLEQQERREKNRKKTKKIAQKKKQRWYNPKINTFVYVSGFPPDTTEEELRQFVCRAGVIRTDPETGKEKIKIYKGEDGVPKGDAAVSYAKEESIGIALEMLNEREFKGSIIKIERAQFNQKSNEYVPRESKKQNKVDKVLARKKIQKHLNWDQEVQGIGFKIVILTNMFTLEQVENEAVFNETKEDIKQQLQKMGEVVRIRFFDTHPDGIVQVKFKQDKVAQQCIGIMNGRFYDNREIQCFYWDGETNYKISQQAQQVQDSRIQNFGKWLEQGDQAGKQEAADQNQEGKEIKLSLADLEAM